MHLVGSIWGLHHENVLLQVIFSFHVLEDPSDVAQFYNSLWGLFVDICLGRGVKRGLKSHAGQDAQTTAKDRTMTGQLSKELQFYPITSSAVSKKRAILWALHTDQLMGKDIQSFALTLVTYANHFALEVGQILAVEIQDEKPL